MIQIRYAVMLVLLLAWPALGSEAAKSTYRGWDSLALRNGLIEVQVVPAIGGRVIQFRLGDFEYLWVNPQLAGRQPPPGGLGASGEWLNYGGDKLWPAPQGWDNDRQWPGPPDAVLDGSPHAAQVLSASGASAAVRLTSRDDPRSGIRFSRVITVFDNAARVSFDSTMTNIDTKPRRWGIWQVTQLNACNPGGDGYNREIRCYSPVNPASRYPRGYAELFGLVNNPSFGIANVPGADRLFCANYRRIVGKVALDNAAGWAATVDGTSGCVFVERFTCYPDRKYPDDASVEFWMNGAGQIVVGGKIVECKDDPAETPHYVENEMLSPLAELKPGESYSFHLDWYAARIGGNFPVVDCTPWGVTCVPLAASRASARRSGGAADGKVRLTGSFGVFQPGAASLVFLDAAGKECGKGATPMAASPSKPLVIMRDEAVPAEAAAVSLVFHDESGKPLGELARSPICK